MQLHHNKLLLQQHYQKFMWSADRHKKRSHTHARVRTDGPEAGTASNAPRSDEKMLQPTSTHHVATHLASSGHWLASDVREQLRQCAPPVSHGRPCVAAKHKTPADPPPFKHRAPPPEQLTERSHLSTAPARWSLCGGREVEP